MLILLLYRALGKGQRLAQSARLSYTGGVLSSSLSREHLALTAEFLRGDEYVLDLRGPTFLNPDMTRRILSMSSLPSLPHPSSPVMN